MHRISETMTATRTFHFILSFWHVYDWETKIYFFNLNAWKKTRRVDFYFYYFSKLTLNICFLRSDFFPILNMLPVTIMSRVLKRVNVNGILYLVKGVFWGGVMGKIPPLPPSFSDFFQRIYYRYIIIYSPILRTYEFILHEIRGEK